MDSDYNSVTLGRVQWLGSQCFEKVGGVASEKIFVLDLMKLCSNLNPEPPRDLRGP